MVKSVTVKSAKDSFELIVECVSSFYILQKKKLNSAAFKNKEGLREILNEIIQLCGINGKVEIDKNIANDYKLTSCHNFPALSLIHSICYDLDLVYDFNSGDIMTISKRTDILHKMNTAVPIVLEKDKIISSEFKQ